MWRLLKVFLLVILLSGFALPSAAKTYFSDICINPEADFTTLRRFVLYEEEMQDREAIFQAEILQGIKETLTRKGYEYGGTTDVKESEVADFVVLVKFSVQQETVYVPPKTILLPQFLPGRTYYTYGNIHSYSFGGWYSFNMRTTESGQWSAVPVTRPGGYETFYVPEVFVQVYSYRNGKPLLLFEGRAYKLLKRAEKPQEYLKSAAKDLMEKFPTKKTKTERPKRRKRQTA